jgi:hypothetical protein
LEAFCISIVEKIKDAFGWPGDIKTETSIGAWTGELPSYLRMVGEADSNSEGNSTAPLDKIDADMRISAQEIASYQVNFNFYIYIYIYNLCFISCTCLCLKVIKQ